MPMRTITGKDPDYNFVKSLGSGGFGDVSQVKRNSDGKIMACKAIDCSSNPEVLKYAQKEIYNWLALSSNDYIATFSNDWSWNANSMTIRLYMEYYAGGDLQDFLNRLRHDEERPHPYIAFTIAKGILNGIAACHEKGIIHRDIKPANILLSRSLTINDCYWSASNRTPLTSEQKQRWRTEGPLNKDREDSDIVKITDLGLGKFVGDAARSTRATYSLMGTPGYIAPETMGKSGSFSTKSDVYSLGWVLYTLFSGRSVHTQAASARLPDLPREYDGSLRSTIQCMISSNPTARPNIDEVIGVVRSALTEYALRGKGAAVHLFLHSQTEETASLTSAVTGSSRRPPYSSDFWTEMGNVVRYDKAEAFKDFGKDLKRWFS